MYPSAYNAPLCSQSGGSSNTDRRVQSSFELVCTLWLIMPPFVPNRGGASNTDHRVQSSFELVCTLWLKSPSFVPNLGGPLQGCPNCDNTLPSSLITKGPVLSDSKPESHRPFVLNKKVQYPLARRSHGTRGSFKCFVPFGLNCPLPHPLA